MRRRNRPDKERNYTPEEPPANLPGASDISGGETTGPPMNSGISPPAAGRRGERETLAFRREEVALDERDAFAGVHPARHSVGGDESKVKNRHFPYGSLNGGILASNGIPRLGFPSRRPTLESLFLMVREFET